MSHTYCPECGNFIPMDGRGIAICNSCGYSNEEEIIANLLSGLDDATIGYVLDDESLLGDFSI